MLTLKLAWRNLWRNRKRTAISLATIGVGTAIMIVAYGLTWGTMAQMVGNVTRVFSGEGQVHAPGYLRDRSIYKTIGDPRGILEAAKIGGVGAAPRSFGFGLVSHGTKSAGAMFWGVDPDAEVAVFDLPRHVRDGGRFLASAPARGMVLGSKLARSLNVGVGDEIVTVVQAADGSLGNELFAVTGIIKTVGEGVDRGAAIIHRSDFQELFVSGGVVHEIALSSRGAVTPSEIGGMISEALGKDEYMTWKQLNPVISDMLRIVDVMMLVFAVVFLLAAGLGVMNTMLMATYERVREFGVQKALGSSPWRIVRDVCVEAFLMGFIGTLGGLVLGVLADLYFGKYGIDTGKIGGTSIAFAGVAFDPVWRAVITPDGVLIPVAVMWFWCVLAALYPAARASRFDPVRAMTHV